MARLASAQARSIQRRALGLLVGGGLAFTLVFAVVALWANATLVPRLANYIADTTAGIYVLSAEDYQRFEDYATGQDAGASAPASASALADAGENAGEGGGENGGGNEIGDVTQAGTETSAEAKTGSETAGTGASSAGADADPAGTGATAVSPANGSGDQLNSGLRELADRGTWDFWARGDGTYVIRDLSTYFAVKQLKVPVAIGLYLLGLLVIAIASIRYVVRRFDMLASSVGTLLADRSRPVELPNELSLVRAKLSGIRAQALADEQAAQAAERRKNELVAYLAHDIKTPLTSVTGYLSLLSEPSRLDDDARREFAGIALDKAERLEGLVDEFFEITRYNLQAIPIERARVDVRLFCQQVAEEFAPQARGRGVELAVEAPEGRAAFFDPDKLARALSNVVRNAIAYADAGTTVEIRASEGTREAREHEGAGTEASTRAGARKRGGAGTRNPGEGHEGTPRGETPQPGLVISVTDRGREISPAHLQSIFEKFFREDTGRATNRGGAGLGLAIAREIVEAHGGQIDATSTAGLTTFRIWLPEPPSKPGYRG